VHLTFELVKEGLTWGDLLLAAAGGGPSSAANTTRTCTVNSNNDGVDTDTDVNTDADAVADADAGADANTGKRCSATNDAGQRMARELHGGAVDGVLGASLLRAALQHDPGWLPLERCPHGMCTGPDAITGSSAELAAPVPLHTTAVEAALGPWGGSGSVGAAEEGDASDASDASASDVTATDATASDVTTPLPALYSAYLRLCKGALSAQLTNIPTPPLVYLPAGEEPLQRAGWEDQPRAAVVHQLVAELSKPARFTAGLERLLAYRERELQRRACPNPAAIAQHRSGGRRANRSDTQIRIL
jgi:hypothetical protein